MMIRKTAADFLSQYNLKKEAALASMVVAASIATVMPSYAGIPVIDAASLTQAIQQVANSITQIQNQVTQIQHLQEQVNQMQRQYASITGHRGMGNLNRGGIETELVQWGNAASGGILQARVDQLKTQFPHLDKSLMILDQNSSQQLAALDKSTNVIYKTHVAAEKTMEDMNAISNRIKTLGDQIESADDVKAALDLQNRLLMEVAMLQAYSIRLQAQGLAHTSTKDQTHYAWAAQEQRQLERARAGQVGLNN